METVLVVGGTGNIGASTVTAALRSGRKVLSVIRSQASADKLIKNVGTSEGITFVEADVHSDTGILDIVNKVKAGELPAFQHVYTCVGPEYVDVPLTDITTERLRYNMKAFEANFFAYRDTIPYLLEQNHPNSTWTICTGSQGELAVFPLPGMTQGPLFSMATAAARENEKTNVRCNEIYLHFRVENDASAVEHGVTKASDFAAVYEQILANPEIRSSRINCESPEDIKKLKYQRKF